MTKTDKITKLLRDGLGTAEIAAKVRCSPAYVRVVKQRVYGNRRVKERAASKISRYLKNPEECRKAYRTARDAGASIEDARKAYLAAKRVAYDWPAYRRAWAGAGDQS